MKKIVRLTESDITKLVKKILNEQQRPIVVTPDYQYVKDRDKKTETLKNKCSANPLRDFYLKKMKERNINIDNIYNALNKSWKSYLKNNYISSEGASLLKREMSKIISLNEYCVVLKKYKEKYNRNLDLDANWAFWKNSAWDDSFYSVISNLRYIPQIEQKPHWK